MWLPRYTVTFAGHGVKAKNGHKQLLNITAERIFDFTKFEKSHVADFVRL